MLHVVGNTWLHFRLMDKDGFNQYYPFPPPKCFQVQPAVTLVTTQSKIRQPKQAPAGHSEFCALILCPFHRPAAKFNISGGAWCNFPEVNGITAGPSLTSGLSPWPRVHLSSEASGLQFLAESSCVRKPGVYLGGLVLAADLHSALLSLQLSLLLLLSFMQILFLICCVIIC